MPRLLLIPTVVEARLLFGDASAAALGAAAGDPRPVRMEDVTLFAAVCGFGLAAAGAGASRAAERMAEQGGVSDLCLAGIAGTYDADRAPVGSAIVGMAVTCWGIGVGEGLAHQSAAALGWEADRLELALASNVAAAHGEILSVTAAPASPGEAARRRSAHPAALAEDMESFAVALAARLRGVPLTVVRGMSNVAGERDKVSWRMPDAIDAVRRLLAVILTDAPAGARP